MPISAQAANPYISMPMHQQMLRKSDGSLKAAVGQSKSRNAIPDAAGERKMKNTGTSRNRMVNRTPMNTNVQELPSVPSVTRPTNSVPMATSKRVAIAALVLLLLGVAGGGVVAAVVILTRASSSTNSAASTNSTASTSVNKKILGGYWPNYVNSPIRIRDIDLNYNLIYLFAAQPVDIAPNNSGQIYFGGIGNSRGANTNFVNDIQYARTVQNRIIILTVGGANAQMNFANRTVSQTFVDNVVTLYNNFGGFDGLDWDTFEGSQVPNTGEMIWISQQLKSRYPGFLITAPPAPWRSLDLTFCQAMVQNNAMDFAAPQYYDGPGLTNQTYIETNIRQWISALNASRVVLGLGVSPTLPNYMTVNQTINTWNSICNTYPTIRGAFNWNVATDEQYNWTFAESIGPLVDDQ